MQFKTFKAPTLKEAMANVKSELGIDAVIVTTKHEKVGGLLGFGGKEIVEVIAAVEDNATSSKDQKTEAVSKAVKPAPAPVVPRNVLNQYQTAGTQQSVDDAQAKADKYDTPVRTQSFGEILSSLDRIKAAKEEIVANTIAETSEPVGRIIRPMEFPAQPSMTVKPESKEAVADGQQKEQPAAELQTEQTLEKKPLEKTEPDTKPLEEPDTKPLEEPETPIEEPLGPDQKTIQSLQNELDSMKVLLAKMGTKSADAGGESLQRTLLEADVEQKVMDDIIRRMSPSDIMADKHSTKALKGLEAYLKTTVKMANGITLYTSRPKVVALIGPTGVGKTTTLAKIAAKFVLDSSTTVALITADTYRISAVEQLKTYSDILGLPLEIVYTPEALKQAIAKHADKQLILVDTAGRSQFNEYQMKELCDLLSVDRDIEKHLVLSSTTKNRDAEEILARFAPCQPDRIIFTKTDETSSLGLILNLLYKRQVALSYMTDGQSVPDDITPASDTKLAELLLR